MANIQRWRIHTIDRSQFKSNRSATHIFSLHCLVQSKQKRGGIDDVHTFKIVTLIYRKML